MAKKKTLRSPRGTSSIQHTIAEPDELRAKANAVRHKTKELRLLLQVITLDAQIIRMRLAIAVDDLFS